jgi:predicted transposase/invertase (TIGR01784 family)
MISWPRFSGFFRENFARPAIARDFLRHHLPQALLAELDLERLAISPDTFVTEALHKVYSDLIYQMPLRDTQLSVYLLFEHKSQSDHRVLLQLLRYIVASGQLYRDENPKAKTLTPAPFPIPCGGWLWRRCERFRFNR